MVGISVLEFNIYTSNFNHCFKFYESNPFDLIIFANANNLSDCSCLNKENHSHQCVFELDL